MSMIQTISLGLIDIDTEIKALEMQLIEEKACKENVPKSSNHNIKLLIQKCLAATQPGEMRAAFPVPVPGAMIARYSILAHPRCSQQLHHD